MTTDFDKEADAPYEARVLWWNSDTLAVCCPLCCEVECHDTQFEDEIFKWDKSVTLTALCRSTGVTYEAVFPWKMGLGWEKNWESKRLDTIGLDLSNIVIRESWQPTSNIISGPSLRAREDPLFWPARVNNDYIGNSKLLSDGHHGKAAANETFGEKRKSAGRTLGSEMSVVSFSPRLILGDMKRMVSERPQSNWLRILAPAATIDGDPLPGPLALVRSDKLLKHKTVAVLDRRGSYKPIIAVSGWKDLSERPNNVLNQEFWSREVLELVKHIPHKLDVHNLDNGLEGRVSSSHAEKQLMAFFVRMHCFLDDGFEEGKMAKLKMLPSRLGLREAWIGIDKPPCKNCRDFKKSIEAVCHVKFHFVLMKRLSRSKKDGKNNGIKEFRTPIRSKAAKLLPLTPPDSGNRSPEEESQDEEEEEEEKEEEEEEEGGEEDDDEDGDPDSPCNQRKVRSLAARPQLRITKGGPFLSEKKSVSFMRNLQKRPRASSEEDCDGDSEYAPPPSPPRKTIRRDQKGRRSTAPTQESPLAYRKPSDANSRIERSHARPQEKRHYHSYGRLSAEEIRAAINEVSDSMEEQEKEEFQREGDVSTDSDVPMPIRRGGHKRVQPRKIIIDLTGDTTDKDNDSEGSCFSP